MSRGHQKIKRHVLLPDRKYGSTLVTKFTNYVMERGKKSIAESIIYGALENSSKKLKKVYANTYGSIKEVMEEII